jgi:hypothetical protein
VEPRRRFAAALAALLLCSASAHAAPGSAPSKPAPRYAQALRAELGAMQLAAECSDQPAGVDCAFPAPSAPSSRMHAVYSDATDTVYVYVERYAMLPPEGSRTATLLRRMMELNWQLLVGKLEWSARTGEVRLSAVLNTDSNFDRRALRSIVLALDEVASRYRGELGGGT